MCVCFDGVVLLVVMTMVVVVVCVGVLLLGQHQPQNQQPLMGDDGCGCKTQTHSTWTRVRLVHPLSRVLRLGCLWP